MAQPFRFIHCGDLHLGAPFKYVTELGKFSEDAIAEATFKAFEKVVDITIEERVDALLISGDVYNSSDHNVEAQVRFVRQLERVTEKNIPVYLVHGNHDPLNTWSAKVPLPEGVYVFSGDSPERKSLVVRGSEVAAIYGMSHKDKGIREDLSQKFRARAEDPYSIGLLHAYVNGSVGNSEYAPCTVDSLREGGMDYWALGHIHKREVISTEPFIVYSGNPQGLSFRESGPKGCYLVRVSATGHTELTFRETDAICFISSHIDISSLQTIQELEEMFRHKKKLLSTKYRRPVLVEYILEGVGVLSTLCADEDTRKLWLREGQEEEKGKYNFVLPIAIRDHTKMNIDLTERRLLPDVLGDYLSAYDEIGRESENKQRLMLRKIVEERPEIKRLTAYKDLLTDDLLEEAFKQAEKEGVLRLVGDADEN